MPKCKLNIVLDEPDRVYPGGGTISGTVDVSVDSDATCKGLELRTSWTTHGSGNITGDSGEPVVIFEGDWVAGHHASYRFDLPIVEWPPTYHGHHLNIDHFVEARAKLPWAIDPKASEPFQMRSTHCEQTSNRKPRKKKNGGCLGLIVIFVIYMFVMRSGPQLLNIPKIGIWFMGALGLAVFLFWFIRSFLPKWALGSIEADLDREQFVAGEAVEGKITISPRKQIAINGIDMTVTGAERCVSGSGSNRRTHRHTLFEQTERVAESTTLYPRGVPQEFHFSINLPPDAPPTIDLHNNDIVWNVDLRVDIPSWPDWRISLPIQVTQKLNHE